MSKILIVEDEEAIADLEKDYLELSGFEVEVANEGTLGLEKALGGDYDLFILDLMLPGVDGFETVSYTHLFILAERYRRLSSRWISSIRQGNREVHLLSPTSAM